MVGERLYDLRKDKGITQDELSSILNINKHSISSYERDKSEPPDSIKIQLAKYFNVSVDYLLGITDIPLAYKENDSTILRLPENLPFEAKDELLEFLKYLIYKYNV